MEPKITEHPEMDMENAEFGGLFGIGGYVTMFVENVLGLEFDRNDPKCLLLAAEYFKIGDQDEVAYRCYKRAVSLAHGSPDVYLQIGLCYLCGSGVEADGNEAFKWIEKAAEEGCSQAYVHLARCYAYGWGTDKDPEKAVDWFERGIRECGDGESYYHYARYRMSVSDVSDDDKKDTFELLFKAEELGYPPVTDQLGRCYAHGYGTEKNEKKAFRLFEKAAECGHAGAHHAIGLFYLYGVIVEEDTEKAKQLISDAAYSGYGPAQFDLGSFYEEGVYGYEESSELAEYWYEKAVVNGYKEAEQRLERVKRINEAMKPVPPELKPALRLMFKMLNASSEQLSRQYDLSLEHSEQLSREYDLSLENRDRIKYNVGLSEETYENVTVIKNSLGELNVKLNELRATTKDNVEFIQKASRMLNDWSDKRNTEDVEKKLREHLGDIWEKLEHETQRSFVSAQAVLEMYRRVPGFKIGIVAFCAAAALESEIRKVFPKGLNDYVRNNKQLIDEFKASSGKKELNKGIFLQKLETLAASFFSLGSFSYFCDGSVWFKDENGKKDISFSPQNGERECFVYLCNKYLESRMGSGVLYKYRSSNYLQCLTQVSFDGDCEPVPGMKIKDRNGIVVKGKNGKPKYYYTENSIAAKIAYIAEEYRNPVAHGGDEADMDAAKVLECCKLIFGDPDNTDPQRTPCSVLELIYRELFR